MRASSPSHYRKIGSTTQLATLPQPLHKPESQVLPDNQSASRVKATRIPEQYWRIPKDTLSYINGVPVRQTDANIIFPSAEPRTEAERVWLYTFSSDVLNNVAGRASYLNLNHEGDIRFVLHAINILQIFCFEISRHVGCITLDKHTYPYEKLAELLISVSHILQGLSDNLAHYAAHEAAHAPLISDLSNFYRYTSPGTDVASLYADIRSTTIMETETSLALITDLERRLDDEKESARRRETELEQRIKSLETELAAQKKNFSRLELELNTTKTIRASIASAPQSLPSARSVAKGFSASTSNLIQGSSALGVSAESPLAESKHHTIGKLNSLDNDVITTNVYSSFSPAPMTQSISPIRLPSQNLTDIYENINTLSVQRSQTQGEGAALQRISEMPISHTADGQQTLGEGADYTVLRSYTRGSQRMLDRSGKQAAELDYIETIPATFEVSKYRDSTEIELYSGVTDPSKRSSAIFQTIGHLMSTQAAPPNRILSRPQTAPELENSNVSYRSTQEIGPSNNSSIDILKLQKKNWVDLTIKGSIGGAPGKLFDSSRQQDTLDSTTSPIFPKGLANAASKFLGAIMSLDEDDAWRLEANLSRQMTKDTPDVPLAGQASKDFGHVLFRQPNDSQAFSLLNPICMPHEKAIGEIDLSADRFRISFQAIPETVTCQTSPFSKQILQSWTDDYLKQYMPDSWTVTTDALLSRPVLLSNYSSSLPIPPTSITPNNPTEPKVTEPHHTLPQPLKSATGRRIPILTKSRYINPEVRPKTSMKTTKSSRRASTNTSPTRPNLLTDVTAEDADPIPTTQLDHDFIDEADAFQGMITLGEGDMSAKLTDLSAHAVTCRTLYAKTRAELHIIYRHIYSLRSTTGDTSVIDRAPEERILLQPRYITQYTKIIDALMQTDNGLQSIPFIKGPSYLESQYGQSTQKKESLMLLTRKLFCSDSIFSFTTNNNMFQALNERIATVSQQELRETLWCDFLIQWDIVTNGVVGQDLNQTILMSKHLENLCRKWDILSIIKMILCYKFDLHTSIRVSDLTVLKSSSKDVPVSIMQMFTNPGFFSGTSKAYFMGLSKATQLYRILKPSMRIFCAKLDSVASRGASATSLKSTAQAKINVEEGKGLMHLKAIVSNIGYTVLDLRTVLGIIHEIIVQRHTSCEFSVQGSSTYTPMDKFLLELFMHHNSMDIDKAHRALISFFLSIQIYILCDHLSGDCGDRDTQVDNIWSVSKHSSAQPVSVTVQAHQSREGGERDEDDTSLFDDSVLDDAPVKHRSVSELTGILQCHEFLLVFLELISSPDHLTTEYICHSYIAFYEHSGAKYPYPFVSLDIALLLTRKLLPELPGPYFALLNSSLKQLAITERYDAPVLDIGTVLRILGSQKRMVRLMIMNTVAEEYGRLLSKELIPQAGPSFEDIGGIVTTGGETLPEATPSVTAGGRRDATKKPKSSVKQKRESKSVDELKASLYLDTPISYENFVKVLSKMGTTLLPAMTARYYYAAMWNTSADKSDSTSMHPSVSGPGTPSLRQIFLALPYVAYGSFPHLFNTLSRKNKLFSTQKLCYAHELNTQHDLQALILRYALCGDRHGYIQELRGTLKTIVYELEAPVKRLASMLTCEANGLAYNMEPFYISANFSSSNTNASNLSTMRLADDARSSVSSLSYTMPSRRHLSVMAMQLVTLYASAKLTIGDASLPEETLVEVIGIVRNLSIQMHMSYQSLRPFNSNIHGLLYELQDRLQGIVRCDNYLCKNVTAEEMLRETLCVDNINGPLARILGMARNSIYIQ
ncbi:hypothetical protein QR46_0808 [Giardia duodenalis assemblage B]|uniref:Uncharacterized protein n=1 Tax=Giardia duodenalis assemblage B TaxID=1394984 RepID=A0A132NYN7_GIAIN|nr:hypothetical protein QR46_0808 [Giardia intestinalis assemblage B]